MHQFIHEPMHPCTNASMHPCLPPVSYTRQRDTTEWLNCWRSWEGACPPNNPLSHNIAPPTASSVSQYRQLHHQTNNPQKQPTTIATTTTTATTNHNEPTLRPPLQHHQRLRIASEGGAQGLLVSSAAAPSQGQNPLSLPPTTGLLHRPVPSQRPLPHRSGGLGG